MLLAVYYRVMEHVGSLESTQEAHPCDFKSNSRCALVRFWNHAYDFSPNCTLLCSITIINTRREISYLRVPMYYSLLNCGILQGFPAPRKNRNSTGEKLRRFFYVWDIFQRFTKPWKTARQAGASRSLYDLQNLFDSLCRVYFVLWLTGSVACPARTSFRLVNIVSRIIKLWHSFSVWYRLMVETSTQRPSRPDSEQHSKTFLNSVKNVN